LLIKKKEVVGFDFGVCAATAESSQCRDAGSTWRRDVEDTKAFALESRPRLVDARGFDRASHNLASRGSQSTNKLSHDSRFYLTRLVSRSCNGAKRNLIAFASLRLCVRMFLLAS